MNFIKNVLFMLLSITATVASSKEQCKSSALDANVIIPQNNCINFSVGAGTGCVWMCNYCANALGTNNYYFTNGVCTYQEGVRCVGNPQAGVTYTCCSA